MLSNRSIPECTVIPELAYPDIGKAIDWLCEAFGFTLRIRIANHRAQMNVGEGAVVLIELAEGGSTPDTPSWCALKVSTVTTSARSSTEPES